MATKTFEELKQMAIQIRDEKANKQNTATRIGTQMVEHLNKLEQEYYNIENIDEQFKVVDTQFENLEADRIKKTTELNISVLYPTKGIGGTNKYDLATAIAQVEQQYRTVVGLKITFINNETSMPETWKYNGGTFTTATNWVQGDGSGGNLILEWKTDVATTRKQVLQQERKSLLQISYENGNGEVINEQYIGTSFIDTEWVKDSNWRLMLNDNALWNIIPNLNVSIANNLNWTENNKIEIPQNLYIEGGVWRINEGKAYIYKASGYYYTYPIKIPKGTRLYIAQEYSNFKTSFLVDKELNVVDEYPNIVNRDDLFVCFTKSNTPDFIEFAGNPLLRDTIIGKQTENLIIKRGYISNIGEYIPMHSSQYVCTDKIPVELNDSFFIDGIASSSLGYAYTEYDSGSATIVSNVKSKEYSKEIITIENPNTKFIALGFSNKKNYEFPLVLKIDDGNKKYINSLISESSNTDYDIIKNTDFIIHPSLSSTVYPEYPANKALTFPLEITLINNQPLCITNIKTPINNNTDYYIIDVEVKSAEGKTVGDVVSFQNPTGVGCYVGRRRYVMINQTYRDTLCFNVRNDNNVSIIIHSIWQINGRKSTVVIPQGIEYASIGDSITISPNSYAFKLANRFNWNLTNLAIGGAKLQDQTTDERLEMIPDNISILTLSCGNNGGFTKVNTDLSILEDIEQNIDSTDSKSTIGCCNRAINKARSKNPLCKIVIVAPIGDEIGHDLECYYHTVIFEAVAKRQGCIFVNCREYLPKIIQGIYSEDGRHPSMEVEFWRTNLIIQELQKSILL